VTVQSLTILFLDPLEPLTWHHANRTAAVVLCSNDPADVGPVKPKVVEGGVWGEAVRPVLLIVSEIVGQILRKCAPANYVEITAIKSLAGVVRCVLQWLGYAAQRVGFLQHIDS